MPTTASTAPSRPPGRPDAVEPRRPDLGPGERARLAPGPRASRSSAGGHGYFADPAPADEPGRLAALRRRGIGVQQVAGGHDLIHDNPAAVVKAMDAFAAKAVAAAAAAAPLGPTASPSGP